MTTPRSNLPGANAPGQNARAKARQDQALRSAAAMSGAVDLSGIKERALRSAQPARSPAASSAGAAGPGEAGPGGHSAVIEVTDATFEAEAIIRSDSTLVVVNLRASWSEASAQLDPILEKLAGEAGGRWVLANVDVDASPGIGQAFRVQSVPTVIAMALGRPVSAFAGPQPEEQVRLWIDDVFDQVSASLSPNADQPEAGTSVEPVDPRLEAAEQLAATGDFSGAQAAYEALVHADPSNTDAAAAAKQMAFLARAQDADPAAIEQAAAAPSDLPLQLAAADVLVLQQNPVDAFARLVAAVRRFAGDDRAAARARLLELFDLFDPADPMIVKARRDLASALF